MILLSRASWRKDATSLTTRSRNAKKNELRARLHSMPRAAGLMSVRIGINAKTADSEPADNRRNQTPPKRSSRTIQ